ncbi:MAG: alpha-galactosidase, partial [Phycisphaerales bacterium]|nr:alpha-galactosidase [Phycisphaerales bacterium]
MITRTTRFAVALATSLVAFASAAAPARAADPVRINVTTAHSALKLFVGDDGRLYESGYGAARENYEFPRKLNRQEEFYPQYGDGFISEPALQITHADGNTSTSLAYVKHETSESDPNIAVTRIELKDNAYPFTVTLVLKAYRNEDLIEQWSEIRHDESGPVTMHRYHSAAPNFRAKEYFLSQFGGDYKREATIAEEKLTPGIKVLDSKIGVRASRYRIPSVIIALDGPAQEESGEVIAASLCWSGSFQIEAELDWQN